MSGSTTSSDNEEPSQDQVNAQNIFNRHKSGQTRKPPSHDHQLPWNQNKKRRQGQQPQNQSQRYQRGHPQLPGVLPGLNEESPLLPRPNSSQSEETLIPAFPVRPTDQQQNRDSPPAGHRTVLDIIYDCVNTMMGKGVIGVMGAVIVLVVLIQTLRVDRWFGQNLARTVIVDFDTVEINSYTDSEVALHMQGELRVDERMIDSINVYQSWLFKSGMFWMESVSVSNPIVYVYFESKNKNNAVHVNDEGIQHNQDDSSCLQLSVSLPPMQLHLRNNYGNSFDVKTHLTNITSPVEGKSLDAVTMLKYQHLSARFVIMMSFKKGWVSFGTWQVAFTNPVRRYVNRKTDINCIKELQVDSKDNDQIVIQGVVSIFNSWAIDLNLPMLAWTAFIPDPEDPEGKRGLYCTITDIITFPSHFSSSSSMAALVFFSNITSVQTYSHHPVLSNVADHSSVNKLLQQYSAGQLTKAIVKLAPHQPPNSVPNWILVVLSQFEIPVAFQSTHRLIKHLSN